MGWRHFSSDSALAIKRFWQDEPDGGVTIATEHDVQDIVDHAKTLKGQYSQRAGWQGDFHQVATIPLTILMDLHKKGIMRDQRALRRWLNNPDNAAWRTRSGAI